MTMQEPNAILVRYGEIGLKGRNRPFFEELLARRLREALPPSMEARVRTFRGRLVVHVPPGDMEQAMARLAKVFGVVELHPAYVVAQDMAAVQEAALAALDRSEGMTFKVAARRGDKSFPLTSMEINRQVGTFLLNARGERGLRVDVHRPDIQIHIEVRDGRVYVYAGGTPGPGGLPVGASGRVTVLLSGGIDSPVALWLLMKRGAQAEAVHFHSPPFTSQRALNKVVDLCRVLAEWGGPIPLHIIHFTAIQRAIHENVPADYGITIMRRFMFRIAEQLSAETGALALATGESMGQVASQTLESIAAISAVTTMPVLRPLIGMDKAEITDLAKEIGTYDISILPYQDCCSLFVPRHPQTKPSLARTESLEARLPVAELVAEALANRTVRLITPFADGTGEAEVSPPAP